MKNQVITSVLFASLLFLLAACEINNDKDFEILAEKIVENNYYYNPGMDCNLPASVHPPYQCLINRDGNTWLGDFSGAYNLQGSWTNNSNLCLNLLTDGTGTYKTKAANGTIRSYAIKWGVLVDNYGVPQTYGNNYVFLYIGSTELDPSLNFIEYDLTNSKIMSAGLVRGNCNF